MGKKEKKSSEKRPGISPFMTACANSKLEHSHPQHLIQLILIYHSIIYPLFRNVRFILPNWTLIRRHPFRGIHNNVKRGMNSQKRSSLPQHQSLKLLMEQVRPQPLSHHLDLITGASREFCPLRFLLLLKPLNVPQIPTMN